jgi:broad specificity phosphatase PhoE
MSSKKAAKYRAAYDTAAVYQFNEKEVLAQIPPLSTETVYGSGLSRSIATGLKLFGDSAKVVSMQQLNEFEMHVIWLPVYLPYKGWTVLSRGLWLLGIEKQGTESYKEAKERVEKVVDFIETKAHKNKQVVLVTHGFINRNIAKELENRDWNMLQNKGSENLGATVLRK